MNKKLLIIGMIAVIILGALMYSAKNNALIRQQETQNFQSPGDLKIEGTVDFDHDGKQELLVHAGFNEALNTILFVDNQKETTTELTVREENGRIRPLYIGYSSAGVSGPVNTIFFKDIAGDVTDEVIDVLTTLDLSQNPVEDTLTSLKVYVWDGSVFNYSLELSDQLSVDFDLSNDLPMNP